MAEPSITIDMSDPEPGFRQGIGTAPPCALFVDNEPAAYMLIPEAFPDWQWTFASSAAEALQASVVKNFAAALLDIGLLAEDEHDSSGTALLDALKRRFPSLAVLMITGYSRGADIAAQCFRSGAVDYMTKPSTTRACALGSHFLRGAMRVLRSDRSVKLSPHHLVTSTTLEMLVPNGIPNHLKALFLGPQAENAEFVESLFLEALRDHSFWRRNFHPEDHPTTLPCDQIEPEFIAARTAVRTHRFGLLARLTRGVPNYHLRYLGHMHSDLLLTAILGEFATIFYSQNNVTAEASPVTTQLESQAIDPIASMLGFVPVGSNTSWGHLCSGGTAANIESIRAARNVRHMAVSLALSARRNRKAASEASADLHSFTIPYKAAARELLSLSTHELLNLPIAALVDLRSRLVREVFGKLPHSQRQKEADRILRQFSPEEIGVPAVDALLREFGLPPLSAYPWCIYVSTTKHYSVDKLADLLGIGRNAVRLVPISSDFSIDVADLEAQLFARVVEPLDQHQHCHLPLAIIAVLGTTEEGAIDDLPAIHDIRRRLREKGVEYWIHADACYGGYFASLSQPSETSSSVDDGLAFLRGLHGKLPESDPVLQQWRLSLERLSGLPFSDSVSIDPHKCGYIPYPAGAMLLKDSRCRFAISCDAPYVFAEGSDTFPGRYTLEGSRPGHVAAGVYLSHAALPLDRSGHGELIARAMLGARSIYTDVKARVWPEVRSHLFRVFAAQTPQRAPVNPPDTSFVRRIRTCACRHFASGFRRTAFTRGMVYTFTPYSLLGEGNR